MEEYRDERRMDGIWEWEMGGRRIGEKRGTVKGPLWSERENNSCHVCTSSHKWVKVPQLLYMFADTSAKSERLHSILWR